MQLSVSGMSGLAAFGKEAISLMLHTIVGICEIVRRVRRELHAFYSETVCLSLDVVQVVQLWTLLTVLGFWPALILFDTQQHWPR